MPIRLLLCDKAYRKHVQTREGASAAVRSSLERPNRQLGVSFHNKSLLLVLKPDLLDSRHRLPKRALPGDQVMVIGNAGVV